MSYQGNGYGQGGYDAPNTTSVSMRLSDKLVERLDDEAQHRNASRTSVVEQALREYFGIDEEDGAGVLDRLSDLEQRLNDLGQHVAKVEQSLSDDEAHISAKHMRQANG